MTKKLFKERCSFHKYGGTSYRLNSIYYDHQYTPEGSGYKYVVKGVNTTIKVPELFNILYNWVVNGVEPPYYVRFKHAVKDKDRFKIQISERF